MAGRRGKLRTHGRRPRPATLRFEPLEPRQLLAGDLVVINEIMYHPADEGGVEDLGEEYVELLNRGTEAVSLGGWQFRAGVDFTFPDVTLPPNGYLVVAANPTTFAANYPDVANVVGGWSGRLSNAGETIELADSSGVRVDRVPYADDGDWSVRARGPEDRGHEGWVWSDAHDGGGRSLELINAAMDNDYGQAWSASLVDRGTPEVANSVADDDIAPIVVDIAHRPELPKSTDAVSVTAQVIDELATGMTVTAHYRVDGAAQFTTVAMHDDGVHDDGQSGDGLFGVALPPQVDGTVVEYYVGAVDAGGHGRTTPSPSQPAGEQLTNLLYQVVDSFNPAEAMQPGSQPTYLLVMTELERAELAAIGDGEGSDAGSHAQMNGTFISVDGTGVDVRYNVGIRNRGAGTARRPPNNYHVNFRDDQPWQDVTALIINSKYTHLQTIGSAVFRMAGLPTADAQPVHVRVNGANLAESGERMFGSYVAVEAFDSRFADDHFPDDGGGNVYKASSGSARTADLTYLGTDPQEYVNAGYSKTTNESLNDWSDLIHLTDVLTNAPDATYLDEVTQVVNVDQWLEWFAVNTLIGNGETNLSTGYGDDYSMYRGVEDPRFVLLPHDLDTVLGRGDRSAVSPNRSIFDATGEPRIDRFLTHPQLVGRYYAVLEELIATVFLPAQINPLIDHALGAYVPAREIDLLKQFVVDRNANVLTQIPSDFSITSNLPIVDGYPQTLTAAGTISGTAPAAATRSVLVGGQLADWTAMQGAWTIDLADQIALHPGINRIAVQAFDGPSGAGSLLRHDAIDIWYDNGSQTNVSGAITADTTWNAASGPYVVTDDVSVSGGATLTIEPGTTLFFNPAAGLTVSGTGRLVAEGTEAARITLTRTPGSTSNWDGLALTNSMQDNILAYVDAAYGDAQGESLHVDHSRLLVNHVSWAPTSETVIEVSHPSLIVRNSYFPSISGDETVHGERISGDEYLVFDGNVFDVNTSGGDVIDFTGAERPGPVFEFLNNVMLGGGDDGIDLDGTDAHIEGNLFTNFHLQTSRNTTANAIATGQPQSGEGNRTEITVVRNTFFDSDHALLLKEDAFATLTNNTFVGMTEAAIQFNEIGGTAVNGPGRGAAIDGNIFWDNAAILKNMVAEVELTIDRSIVPPDLVDLGVGNRSEDPRLADPAANDVSLRPGSPALGTGPNGLDMGAVVPAGASISGAPPAQTAQDHATLTIGGPGIAFYKYRVNGGPLSEEFPVATPLELTGLADGSYTVDVLGHHEDQDFTDLDPADATVSKTWVVDTSLARVRISEVLARNQSAVEHEGTFPDLIELVNDGGVAVDLTGMSLSDRADNPTKFVFPAATVIEPGEYLVLYADDATTTSGLHLGFSLDADRGEQVLLLDRPATGGAVLDQVAFGIQTADLSISRVGHDGQWALSQPTLGAANVAQPTGDQATLRINEWLANPEMTFTDDFVELYNPDPLPVAVGGLWLTDDPVARRDQSEISPLSFIAAEGFVAWKADGDPEKGANHVDFRLSPMQELIGLSDSDFREIDKIIYYAQAADVSQGRRPNGAGNIEFFTTPTPGLANPGREGPVLSHSGGEVPAGFELTISAPEGVIYYTTDGSDPQLPGGTINPNAEIFGEILVDIELIRAGGTWKYLDDGSDQMTAWQEPGFDTSGWAAGPAVLGYGDNQTTIVSYGSDSGDKYITTYFRHDFSVNDVSQLQNMVVELRRDDGAVVYVNGVEALRSNMPQETPIDYLTRAASTVGGGDESLYFAFDLDPTLLVDGSNVVAVEVHQRSSTSSDVSFDLRLTGQQLRGDSVLTINETTVVKTRSLLGGDDWSELTEALFSVTPAVLPGDLNGDGQVNGLDVDPFVATLLSGDYQAAADMNGDSLVNGIDVDPFVAVVVGGGVARTAAVLPAPAAVQVAAYGEVARAVTDEVAATDRALPRRVAAVAPHGRARHIGGEARGARVRAHRALGETELEAVWSPRNDWRNADRV